MITIYLSKNSGLKHTYSGYAKIEKDGKELQHISNTEKLGEKYGIESINTILNPNNMLPEYQFAGVIDINSVYGNRKYFYRKGKFDFYGKKVNGCKKPKSYKKKNQKKSVKHIKNPKIVKIPISNYTNCINKWVYQL